MLPRVYIIIEGVIYLVMYSYKKYYYIVTCVSKFRSNVVEETLSQRGVSYSEPLDDLRTKFNVRNLLWLLIVTTINFLH